MIEVNAKGVVCPMPLIKLKRALSQNNAPGTVFRLIMSDKGGEKDIPAFCQQQALSCKRLASEDGIVFEIARLAND